MEQKILITGEDMNTILESGNTRNSLNEIGTDITWCGRKVAVRRFLPFADMMSFVDGVVSGCFAKSDNRYLPEARDLFFRCSIVGFYTNIVLPDPIEEKNQILYGTNIIDMILQNIDMGQFRAIMDGIDKKIDHLVNTDMKRIEEEAQRAVKEITDLCEALKETFSDIGGEEMSAFMEAVTKMNFDEKALIEAAAAIERQKRDTAQRDGLKVVK